MDDGEGTQSGTGETQSGAAENTGTSGGSNTITNPEGAQSGTVQTADTEAQRARAEAESFRERMKAADARAAKFEQELRQLRDKDLPEADKLKRDYEEAVKARDALTEANRQLALEVAFLKDNSVTWHSPESALKLVDLSQVTVNDDGTVTGMKDALTALAKSNPFLVKTETSEGSSASKTPPATSPANNGGNAANTPKAGAMASRLPVMRTRFKV